MVATDVACAGGEIIMSEVIWKFQVPVQDRFQLDMPVGSTVLSVNQQHGKVCMWASVDTDAETSPRNFALVGTGHVLPSCHDVWRTFIGTVMLHGGDLVFHLFEMEDAS